MLVRSRPLASTSNCLSPRCRVVSGITDRGYGDPDPAGLYRALRDMEDDGLVTSSWELGDHGPARRMYAVTDQGLAALDEAAAAARAALRCLDRMLGHYRRMGPHGHE